MNASAPLLEVKALNAHYGRIGVLHDVSLSVHTGEVVSVLGANGAGKTTLMRALCGLVETNGSISLGGEAIQSLPPWSRTARGMAIAPEGRQVWPALSVTDNLLLGGYLGNPALREEGLARMFERFPVLRDKARQPAGMLSGGQQQMLAIGRALMSRPRLLLLDEPSMGLAPLLVAEVFAIVAELRGEGITTVLVEQNASGALRVCDRAYVLETGRVVLEGRGSELLSDPRVQQSYLGM